MTPASTPRTVQRQRRLPLSKAVQIAWKQIRMRLSRSLLVTSGIVLAIAFLIAIQINDAFADGMRSWIARAPASPGFATLRTQREQVEAKLAEARRAVIDQATPPPVNSADGPFDIRGLTGGATLDEIKQELGELPLDGATLQQQLDQHSGRRGPFRAWLDTAREAKAIRDALSAPKLLESRLAENGIPVEAGAVAAGRLQTRWLLGLALLVAFVGILNAMLMSVTERFREIGTMKCLGALDGFIVKLFLIESLFQGIVGTAAGIVLGVSVSVLMNLATYGSAAFHEFQLSAMLRAIGMSAVVGIILTVAGAVWPAWQAARMRPIEAMRVEA